MINDDECELIYPTLDLFLYDLRNGLGQSKKEIEKNRINFLERFNLLENENNCHEFYYEMENDKKGNVEKKIIYQLKNEIKESIQSRDQNFEIEYLELLKYKRIFFENKIKDENCEFLLKGYYYPVRLNDVYGLLIDCSVEKDIKTENRQFSTTYFKFLKKQIERRRNNQKEKIGETWLISGELVDSKTNPEIVAQKCYQELMQKASWENNLQNQGYLYGGHIFELWGYDSTCEPTQLGIVNKHHVVIALYPTEEAARKAAALNYSFLRLFGYRSKIFWAYSQSLSIKEKLKKEFIKIQEHASVTVENNFPRRLNLKLLRKTLIEAQDTLAKYSTVLVYLDDQNRMIEINLLNYRRRLAKIQKDILTGSLQLVYSYFPCGSDKLLTQYKKRIEILFIKSEFHILHDFLYSQVVANDLNFLEEFSEVVTKKYLLQVQKDYTNFSPGLRLLEGIINSVRGIAEIDQAERDRTFQNTVAIVGTGLAAAALTASVSGQFPNVVAPITIVESKEAKEIVEQDFGEVASSLALVQPWLMPLISLILSLVVGLFVAGGMWGVIQGLEKLRKVKWKK